jgi:hypothetical protein
MKQGNDVRGRGKGVAVITDFILADYLVPGAVMKTEGEAPEGALSLGEGYYYIPEGVPIPPEASPGEDVSHELLLEGLFRYAGRENLIPTTVKVGGLLHTVRFLEAHGSYVPAEIFTLYPIIAKGLIRVRISFSHRYLLKDTLTNWFNLKGQARTRGIWVVVPGSAKVDRVLAMEPGKARLEKQGLWDPDNAKPFLAWEELPAGLRKKTLVTQAITPGEVIKKVNTFVDYAFSGSAERFKAYESGTLWKPRNLVFEGGITGNYIQELFWAGKRFFKPLEAPARVALLLPSDQENEPISDFFVGIIDAYLPELGAMGLPLEKGEVCFYDPRESSSLEKAVESLGRAKPDMLLGIVVPTGTVGEKDPYFCTKRRLADMGYPSQMIKVSTVRKFRDRCALSLPNSRKGLWEDELFQGFWINTALKLGAIPWLIRDSGLQDGLAIGISRDERAIAVAVFDHHMRFHGWKSSPGPLAPELFSEWKAKAKVFHIEGGDRELAEFLSELGDVCSVAPAHTVVAPATRRAKLRAGLYFMSPDDPDAYLISTENWAPYREFNLYEVRKVSGSLSPVTHASICFWAARAYLSSFPKGPLPATLHFARAIRNAISYGFVEPGQGGERPWFL